MTTMMALMREDAVANRTATEFAAVMRDIAEGADEPEIAASAEPVEDDGYAVSVPGLDPRLMPAPPIRSGGDA